MRNAPCGTLASEASEPTLWLSNLAIIDSLFVTNVRSVRQGSLEIGTFAKITGSSAMTDFCRFHGFLVRNMHTPPCGEFLPTFSSIRDSHGKVLRTAGKV